MEREKIILNSFFIFKKKKDWVGTHTHTHTETPAVSSLSNCDTDGKS
jgi:hypothetical protein